jgi:hypothetical protein
MAQHMCGILTSLRRLLHRLVRGTSEAKQFVTIAHQAEQRGAKRPSAARG